MPMKFPQTRLNGGFTIRAIFSMSGIPLDLKAVSAWLEDWTSKNQTWTRKWQGTTERSEVLVFADSFVGAPRVSEGPAQRVEVRLDAPATAVKQPWKDWLVRLTEELCQAFSNLELESYESILEE